MGTQPTVGWRRSGSQDGHGPLDCRGESELAGRWPVEDGRVRRKRDGDRQGCGGAGGLRRARAAPLPDHRSNPDGMTRNGWTAWPGTAGRLRSEWVDDFVGIRSG